MSGSWSPRWQAAGAAYCRATSAENWALPLFAIKLTTWLADSLYVQRSTVWTGLLLGASAAALGGVAVWVSGGLNTFVAPPARTEGYASETGGSGAGTPLERMPRLPSASAPGAGPMLTPEYTIRKTIPEVQLQFSVADQKGRLVQGLSASDIRVLDNQLPVSQIQHFERVDDLPLRVGIVLDVSGSMRKVIPEEKVAALAFLRQVLRPQSDRAFVMAFGSEVEVRQDSTEDTESLASAIENVSAPNRGTELFDALYSACNDHWKQSEADAVHRVIIVVTDGQDTGSLHTLQDVVAAAERNEIQIYPLAIHSRNRIPEGDGVLRELAEQSGGKFYVAASAKDVAPMFAEIEQDLRTQYYVSFRPEDDRPGFHSLRVEVRSPEKLQVHARQGYYSR